MNEDEYFQYRDDRPNDVQALLRQIKIRDEEIMQERARSEKLIDRLRQTVICGSLQQIGAAIDRAIAEYEASK